MMTDSALPKNARMPKDTNKITKEEVKKIAQLARIELTDEEVEKFQTEFTSILEYVQKIKEVDTKSIKEEPHITQTNVFRDDTVEESLSQDEAISNRKKQSKDGYFTIKSVLDHK